MARLRPPLLETTQFGRMHGREMFQRRLELCAIGLRKC